MKRLFVIGIALLFLVSCHTPTRKARRMVACAERLADTLPDSTARLIDSVLRMPASFSERERMDMALLQAEALFGDHGQEISPIMDDDFFDNHANLSTSPELERAAAYYARKKQYGKAAHAALYSGFVQQHYNEKEAAMRSFKEAEQYGKMVDDSLTVALAEYRMGKMLYDDYLETEAISVLKKADINFGSRLGERAYVHNLEAAVYMVLKQFDYAEKCLKESLDYAEQGQSIKAKRKAQNNFSVLYRQIGNYTQAKTCLMGILNDSDLTVEEEFLLYLNLGKTFVSNGEIDSAKLCFHRVERMIPNADVKDEAKISAFGALSRFAESQGDDSLSLKYRESHDNLMYEVMRRSQKQSVFRIQRQYDYESLQNEMNRKLIRRQRVITFFGILTIIGLTALAVSQIRLAKIRKREAEVNANLFHFMQQNKALVESNMRHEQKVEDVAQQLSDMLHKRLMAMLKLDYCLKTPIDKIAAKDLEKEVFGDGDHWEAVKEVLDSLYPGLWETIGLKYPDMDEMERRVCMLSRLKLSRLSEAALLGVSVSVLDKLRTKVRKTVEQEEKR